MTEDTQVPDGKKASPKTYKRANIIKDKADNERHWPDGEVGGTRPHLSSQAVRWLFPNRNSSAGAPANDNSKGKITRKNQHT